MDKPNNNKEITKELKTSKTPAKKLEIKKVEKQQALLCHHT